MKKSIVYFLFLNLISSGFILPAQEKLLTPEDAIYMNRELYPGRISQLQ